MQCPSAHCSRMYIYRHRFTRVWFFTTCSNWPRWWWWRWCESKSVSSIAECRFVFCQRGEKSLMEFQWEEREREKNERETNVWFCIFVSISNYNLGRVKQRQWKDWSSLLRRRRIVIQWEPGKRNSIWNLMMTAVFIHFRPFIDDDRGSMSKQTKSDLFCKRKGEAEGVIFILSGKIPIWSCSWSVQEVQQILIESASVRPMESSRDFWVGFSPSSSSTSSSKTWSREKKFI